MCLLLIALGAHPDFPLVVAGNRDEYYARPTAAAAWRDDRLCGLDLEAGGTWMGVNRRGRFVTVTNYRNPAEQAPGLRSRGLLVQEALQSPLDGAALQRALLTDADSYNGFNLVFGDPRGLYAISNRGPSARLDTAGIYGLSNHLLETPWPKVERGKSLLRSYLEGHRELDLEALFSILADKECPSDRELPNTGVRLELERLLAPIFIASADYGTRASTLLLYGGDGSIHFAERGFGPGGMPLETREYRFSAI